MEISVGFYLHMGEKRIQVVYRYVGYEERMVFHTPYRLSDWIF
jgi:hypothetical protein